jgi:hypothetical protein
LIEEKSAEMKKSTTDTVDNIVGLGLESDYLWNGEDLVEALRMRTHLTSSRHEWRDFQL